MERTTITRKQQPPHHADDLSFMRRRRPKGSGIDYWVVAPVAPKIGVGGYTADCETGRRLADEYLSYIGKHPTYGNATLLTCIVHEMIDRAKAGEGWSGINVGFLSQINRHAMAMAAALARPDAVEAELEAA